MTHSSLWSYFMSHPVYSI